jgi:aryl sulfotransferase
MSFFHVERSYWRERARQNVLLVHYKDLKADRSAEMKRVATFLNIEISPGLWPKLIETAGFEAMKKSSEQIVSLVAGDPRTAPD